MRTDHFGMPAHGPQGPSAEGSPGPRAARRRSRRAPRLLVAVVAAGCAVGTGVPALAATPSGGTAGRAAVRAPSVATVTLVTGDRVRVTTRANGVQDAVLVPDRADRRPGGYLLHRGGDLYVIPAEALPYLRAGRLDPALFDVTRLVAAGLDDARSRALRLIVTAPGSPVTPTTGGTGTAAGTGSGTAARTSASAAPPATAAPTPPPGSTATVKVPTLGLTGVRVDKQRARTFWQAIDPAGASAAPGSTRPSFATGVGRLWLDRTVHATLDRSVPQIGAPAAYAAGLDGHGITVGVVDTGIDDQNPDVAPQVIGQKNFVAAENTTDDLAGHGTHVASIIAGSGAASGGKYRGVAPGAKLLDARVLDSSGNGTESDVMAGMEWAAQQGAQVVNLSLGGMPTDGTDPVSLAVNTLTARYGSLFVIAAGNAGTEGSIGSPGAADDALTVGAVDRSDVLAGFSSRGPRVGDGAIKPEITAPGVDIVAARADGTQLGPVAAPGYVVLSGTSMATPHVAGAAALLKQHHPGWTPAELKADLVATAKPSTGSPVWDQGVGRVDVAAAIATGGLCVDRGTLSLGFNPWPHGNDPIRTGTLTYRNTGTGAVTLTVASALTDDAGTALPAGAITVSPSTLDLPPGGSGTVTVTVNPNKATVGRWGGLITATSTGGVTLRTAAGFVNETEHYTLTVDARGRTGDPVGADVFLFNPQTGQMLSSWDLSEPTKLRFRVVPGTWSVLGMAMNVTDAGTESLLLARTGVQVTGDTTTTLDGTTARPVRLGVPDRDVAPSLINATVSVSSDQGSFGVGVATSDDTIYATPTAATPTGSLVFDASATLRVPELLGSVVSPTPTVLHPQLLWGDDRLDGRHRWQLADAAGDVRGRVALLGVGTTGAIDDDLARLAAAGAVAVLTYPTGPDGAGGPTHRPAVPAVFVPGPEGTALAGLLGHGRVVVGFTGTYYTPRVYDVAREWTDGIPQQVSVRFTRRDLARVEESYRDNGSAAPASELALPELVGGVWAISSPVRPGGSRTAYVTGDRRWSYQLEYGAATTPGYEGLPSVEWVDPPTRYRTDRPARRTWITQVARPALPDTTEYLVAARSGDDLLASIPAWTDGDGRGGSSWLSDVASWTLRSGDRTIASGSDTVVRATLPAQRQVYTLDFTDRSTDPTWVRSTRTTTRWTFPSEHVPVGTVAPLPLLSLDPAIPLDDHNAVPAGSTITFPVTGRLPSGTAAPRLESLSAQVSTDGGSTWRAAKVHRTGTGTFAVTVTNPTRPGTVSLRFAAEAEGDLGIRQEVIAAYAVR